MPSRTIHTLQLATLAAVFGAILIEWAGYVSHVSRLSYALVVPVLALGLAFFPRHAEPDFPVVPTRRDRRLGTALLFASALLLAEGSLAGIFTVSMCAVPVAVLAVVVSWYGLERLLARRWAAALLFLVVPVPMPLLDRVNPHLTKASGAVAVFLVRPFDGDATWIGSNLTFRGWTLEVAEACSGSGTLLTYFVLTLFLIGLFRPGRIAVAVLFLGAVPLTLFVNGLRIGATALLLDGLGPKAAEGLAHELLGQGLVIGAAGLLALGVAFAAGHRRRPA